MKWGANFLKIGGALAPQPPYFYAYVYNFLASADIKVFGHTYLFVTKQVHTHTHV